MSMHVCPVVVYIIIYSYTLKILKGRINDNSLQHPIMTMLEYPGKISAN